MKNYKQMSSAAKDLDKAVNAAKADLEPIKDDVEEHREINEKIGSIYSCSDQLSIFRHTLKLLLDKNKIIQFRTDMHGTVSVRSDGENYDIETENGNK